jgi:hypothetical protein
VGASVEVVMTGRDANAATALAPPFPIASSAACVDLYWIPLGAGGHSVRFNGIVYEATAAWFQHRPRLEIYHSALEVEFAGALYAVEMTPVPNRRGWERGVVAGGAVAAHVAGRFRIFRYEVRRWQDGIIPDLAFAVAGPIRLSDDPRVARRLLALLPSVPTPTWGRDELRAGEMWSCNSIISWAITAAGIDTEAIPLPPKARAPGWDAGITIARRARLDVAVDGAPELLARVQP